MREDAKVWQPGRASTSFAGKSAGDKAEMGQIAGVAKGLNGSVWVFCRGDRVWDGGSFTGSRNEQITYTEPIKQKTVYQLDQDTGDTCSQCDFRSMLATRRNLPRIALL